MAGGWLFVHAHPDDESITTGGTMARLTSAGTPVTLVTCTRGERGEVIGEELAHLQGDGPALGKHREAELAEALAALGVTDHRWLGDVQGRRFEDSGMAWGDDGRATAAPDVGADAFTRADIADAGQLLADIWRQVRPDVVVTYDAGGGYGHPDHIHANKVTRVAARIARAWGAAEPELYATVVPAQAYAAAADALRLHGIPVAAERQQPPPGHVPNEAISVTVDIAGSLDSKRAALAAHATQIVVRDDSFALSNGIYHPLLPYECYAPLMGEES